jgi:hypothetical protein
MKRLLTFVSASILFLFVFTATPARAVSLPDTFYFWMGPHDRVPLLVPLFHGPNFPDSFVMAVPQAQGLQISALLAQGKTVGVSTTIASGGVPYNKDYYAPEHPVWNWHVLSVTSIFDYAITYFPAVVAEYLDSAPSYIGIDPDGWIDRNQGGYLPRYYRVISAVDQTRPGLLVNVSNRALTGAGENTAITGFIVRGGEPRNLVIRALGPSLAASGIAHGASNPAIEIFQGSIKIASNLDWRNDPRSNLLTQLQLAPPDDKEAALYLTLLPGAYTVHTVNQDASQGVTVTDVYDVDGGDQIGRAP